MTAARISSDTIQSWLVDKALPLWSRAGLDSDAGGFVETLTLDHRPRLDSAKRMRVQARQCYVYSHAHLLGLEPAGDGPNALDAAAHGFAFLTGHYWDGSDGGFVFAADRGGAIADSRREAYEQAFALFAAAWYYRASSETAALDWAHRIVAWLDARLADAVHGGLHENPERGLPRRQNPHMHYLEALLALYEATGDAQWRDRASAIVTLFRGHFFDNVTGTLGEFFGEDWQPAADIEGQIVEPGHHFEWVWLLHKYARLTGDDTDSHTSALYRFGETHGRDTEPGAGAGLAYDAVLRDGSVHDGNKRLWVQTEAIKAQLARFEHTGDDRAGAALEALTGALFERYLSLGNGSWYDHLDRAGKPFGDNAPASSFYHVFLALTEVLRLRGDLPAL